MSSKLGNQEIVHEGWLTKSPPSKRLWRGRWRKRWFVLRHSGELPDQYFLSYYTDKTCKTMKGQIDLDQCEQVDAGLQFEDSKQKYQFMFDVKTPKRIYYLAAESEADMNQWVECVCRVCGLKAEGEYPRTELFEEQSESPPVSPSSTASGPYIPISECTSGKPWTVYTNIVECYDLPRRLRPSTPPPRSPSNNQPPPPRSPATDADSVFSDDETVSVGSKPGVNWDTFPIDPPPRPPKRDPPSHTYCNLDPGRSRSVEALDSTYDCPRSHPRPNIFRYDFGPSVDRELKPRRKGSEEGGSPGNGVPPSVDRRLKPPDLVLPDIKLMAPPRREARPELQYLDLDHDVPTNATPTSSLARSTPPARSPPAYPHSPSVTTPTVYKTVDFLKTEAFNRTRQRVEEERKHSAELIH